MTRVTVSSAGDFWAPLRSTTPARIGLGRSGNGLPTHDLLSFETARMQARDAVHTSLDTETASHGLRAVGFAAPTVISSLAPDRATYLRRPDLGRRPASLDALTPQGADICLVLADGLSPRAVTCSGPSLGARIRDRLITRFTLQAPVIATQARVAIGDHIGHRLGVPLVIVIIGERPGLSVADSLGAYVTFQPHPGRRDSERNCVSNIHRRGMSLDTAASLVDDLVTRAFAEQVSGIRLKNALTPAAEQHELDDRAQPRVTTCRP